MAFYEPVFKMTELLKVIKGSIFCISVIVKKTEKQYSSKYFKISKYHIPTTSTKTINEALGTKTCQIIDFTTTIITLITPGTHNTLWVKTTALIFGT